MTQEQAPKTFAEYVDRMEQAKHEDGLDPVRRVDAYVVCGEMGIQLLVDRFLRWPLPASVRGDDYSREFYSLDDVRAFVLPFMPSREAA